MFGCCSTVRGIEKDCLGSCGLYVNLPFLNRTDVVEYINALQLTEGYSMYHTVITITASPVVFEYTHSLKR